MSWCLGKTGKHLFLADGDDGKPPLLLRMVSDRRNLKFMWVFLHQLCYLMVETILQWYLLITSLLRLWTVLHWDASSGVLLMQTQALTVSFSSSGLLFSLLYCNSFETLTSLLYIDLVGWSTSSIRRRSELPKVINNNIILNVVCYTESVVLHLILLSFNVVQSTRSILTLWTLKDQVPQVTTMRKFDQRSIQTVPRILIWKVGFGGNSDFSSSSGLFLIIS